MARLIQCVFSVCLLLLPAAAHAQQQDAPIEPFRMAYNLYYVGTAKLGAYLVATPEGEILINSNLSADEMKSKIERLGFKIDDVKILLINQATADHAAAAAELLRLSGAKYMVMDGDRQAVEQGGRGAQFEPAKVDRVLHDRDSVTLGGFSLVAYKTAGPTAGATTWTMQVMSKGRLVNVVLTPDMRVEPGTNVLNLPHHPAIYPTAAADYKKSFKLLASLPAQLYLSANAADFQLQKGLEKLQKGANESVWVDEDGYPSRISQRQRAFRKELASERAPGPTAASEIHP